MAHDISFLTVPLKTIGLDISGPNRAILALPGSKLSSCQYKWLLSMYSVLTCALRPTAMTDGAISN
jgi:hypothetical protein